MNRFDVASVTALLVLTLGTAACGSANTDDAAGDIGPRYEPVDAEICDDIAPLLDGLQADFGVTMTDDPIATDLTSSNYEVAECYVQLSGSGPGIYPQVIVWTMVRIHDSSEVGEVYEHQQEIVPASGKRYEPGSAQAVDGIGTQALALTRVQRLYDENWSEYRLIGRDRNLVLRIDVAFVSDTEQVAVQTLADLVQPLADGISGLIPQS